MQFVDDSGIESEDKLSSGNATLILPNSTSGDGNNEVAEIDVDLDIVFCGTKATRQSSSELPVQPSLKNSHNNFNQLNTCRLLQRKLELKVERAKRAYANYQEENKKNSHSSLIPINRLSIPGGEVDQRKPLVDYKSESEESEEVSFFPTSLHQHGNKYVKLSDNFSLQEMTIESDNDLNDTPNLELLAPKFQKSFTEYLRNCFCFHRKI